MNEFCARHRLLRQGSAFSGFSEEGVLQVLVDGLFTDPDAQQGTIEIFTRNILSARLVADGKPRAAAGQPFEPDLAAGRRRFEGDDGIPEIVDAGLQFCQLCVRVIPLEAVDEGVGKFARAGVRAGW